MFTQPSNCSKCDFFEKDKKRCDLGYFKSIGIHFNPDISLHKDCRLIIDSINKVKSEKFDRANKERKVLIPQVYKHFKNKLYCTMAISEPIDDSHNLELSDFDIIYIKHTEKENPVGILKNKNTGKYYHLEEIEEDKLVLYRSLYDGTGIYGRPREMFLSPVDRKKYPNVKQKWRMEVYDGKEEK